MQLMGDLKEARGYWKLHEMALFGELTLEGALDMA